MNIQIHSIGRLAGLACGAGLLLGACSGGSGGGANQPPVAVAALQGEAVMQATTLFDSSGSSDPDGRIVNKSWNYGDGESGSEDAHVYKAVGSYTAMLTVTDDRGATASASVAVKVAKCSTEGSQAAALSPYPTVCLQTTRGEMVAEVFPAEAPVTAANFLSYVDEGFYAGTLIHRVVPGFVIQGGGYTSGLVAKAATHGPIVLESNNGLKNWQYTLAMARGTDPNSATSQFFINLVDNPGLDYSAATAGANGYAVFGQVISGTAVVEQIGAVPTATSGGLANVPVSEIVIRSAVRVP